MYIYKDAYEKIVIIDYTNRKIFNQVPQGVRTVSFDKVNITCQQCATNAPKGFILQSAVLQEMRVGPSESTFRSRFQTTLSCAGKEPGW